MEEIEVLEAIYGDDIAIDVINSNKCRIRKLCKPRVDVVYVETVLEIVCEGNIIKSLQFKSMKGITNIPELELQIQSFVGLNVVENDENLTIFQIIENVTEYLDTINIPECLICCESVNMHSDACGNKINMKSDIHLDFIKTACNHIFHFECICKWAFISYENKQLSKETLTINNTNNIVLKASNGKVSSLKQDLVNMNTIHCMNVRNVEIISNKIDILKKILFDIGKLPKSKFKNKIESDIDVNLNIEDYDDMYHTDMDRIQSKILKYNDMLLKIKTSEEQNNKKIEKIKKKLKESEMEYEKNVTTIKNMESTSNSIGNHEFPCPICRAVLTTKSCLVGMTFNTLELKQHVQYFNNQLENLKKQERAINNNNDDFNIRGEQQQAPNSDSVLACSDELIQMIRKIQKQQAIILETKKWCDMDTLDCNGRENKVTTVTEDRNSADTVITKLGKKKKSTNRKK